MFNNAVLPSEQQLSQAAEAITARGIHVELVDTGAQALEIIKATIPEGATVMTGASLTLQEIGFEEMLIAKTHPWVNFKDTLLAETDFGRQMALRRESTLADYFLGSVQAIAETGELVVASSTGSQIPGYAFSSVNVILVAGIQKIVPTLEDALRRVREYSLPREIERMRELGYSGTQIGKLLIIEQESAFLQRNVRLILVKEPVGA